MRFIGTFCNCKYQYNKEEFPFLSYIGNQDFSDVLDAFDFLKPKHDYKGFVKEVLAKEIFGSTDDLTVTKEESEWRLIYLFMFFTNILIIVSSVQILSNSIEYEAAVYYSPRVSISKQAIGKENNIRRTLMCRIFTGF